MTDYTKTTNFATKDALPSGNANKIVKGTEINTEFDNIATAVATKSNTASPTFTGIVSFPDGSASDPSITNTGDTNVGLFFSAGDTLAFTAGGTSQFTMADGVIAPVTDSDVDLGTSSLYFKNAYIDSVTTTGNITIGGNLDVAGTLEFDSLSGTGTIAVTDILDQDDMSGDSATALATQQSIKAYVDAQQDTVDTFGEVLALSNTTGGTDIAVSTDDKVQFRDSAIYINSSADGQLDIVADTEIQIAATTIDINGAVALNGAVTGATNVTLSGELDAATGDFSGNVDIDGNLDVDGTTNLDAVDIDGATQIDATVSVGVDDTGYDVKFFGDTASAFMEWDASTDDLILGGAGGLIVPEGQFTLGSTAVTSTAAELNILDGATVVVGEINALDLGDTAVGTAIASKAVILDSNKDYTGIRNLTISGELDAATLDISGNADIDGTLEADAITVNGTALNTVIAGVTVTNASTAAVATTVTITDNESTDESNALIFTAGGDVDGGNLGLESDGTLTYNPSTGVVTATGFAGTLTGNVTGNVSGTAATVTGAAQGNITSLGTLTSLDISGDATVGDDLSLDSDAAVLNFGANSEIKVIHAHDSGLNFKHTATADDKPFTLTLQTGETDIAADDVLGVINFQAPDEATGTDAILVAAGIAAVSEGDFSASSNATKLSFRTGASETATEKMSLSSGGNLSFPDDGKVIFGAGNDLQIYHDGSHSYIKDAGVGDLILQAGNDLILQQPDGSTEYLRANEGAGVQIYHNGSQKFLTTSTGIDVTGTITADGLNLGDASVINVGTIALDTIKGDADDNTNITFAGSDTTTFTQGGTQRLAVNTSGINVTGTVTATGTSVFASLDISGDIDVDGNFLVGTTDSSVYNNSANATADNGFNITSSGQFYGAKSGATVGILNRTSSDGDILQFNRSGTAVGSIGANGGRPYFVNSVDGGIHLATDGYGRALVLPANESGAPEDNLHYLGSSSYRWRDLYLSGGVVFGATGGSVSSKTLEDYEEGTFTPVLSDSATGGNLSGYSVRNARYTKVGRMVTVVVNFINITTVGMTASNLVYLQGLPFSVVNVSLLNFVGSQTSTGITGAPNIVLAGGNATYMYTGIDDVSDIASGTADYYLTVTYEAA